MKTVAIFDQIGQDAIKFFVADEDLSRFHGKYINTYTKDKKEEKLLRALNDYIYDDQGNMKVIMTEEFPVQAVKDGAGVIVCGFLP